MTMLDPKERTARGIEAQARILATPAPEPATLQQSSWRDYVFAEVWMRPGLDLRSRYLISIASAANTGDAQATESYVRGALANRELTLAELREAALHVAVYCGWTFGDLLDAAIDRAAGTLGLPAADYPAIRAEPWDPAVRHSEGQANFQKVMVFGGPPPQTAYFEGGIVNFVFGEMWTRPGLDERSRRFLTLVGVANSSSSTPIRSHVWSAMASGNATKEEMFEFVLQYAIHAGWPRASVVQGAVIEQGARVEKGLAFEP